MIFRSVENFRFLFPFFDSGPTLSRREEFYGKCTFKPDREESIARQIGSVRSARIGINYSLDICRDEWRKYNERILLLRFLANSSWIARDSILLFTRTPFSRNISLVLKTCRTKIKGFYWMKNLGMDLKVRNNEERWQEQFVFCKSPENNLLLLTASIRILFNRFAKSNWRM